MGYEIRKGTNIQKRKNCAVPIFIIMTNEIEKKNFWSNLSPRVSFLFGLLAGLVIFSLIGFILTSIALIRQGGYITRQPSPSASPQLSPTATPEPQGMEAKIIGSAGTFYEVDNPICKDGGKPIIRLFSTTWCPHCQWVSSTFDKVAKDYVKKGKIVAHHWQLDTNDDTLTTEVEKAVPNEEGVIYNQFNPGGSIPTFVFGCRYYRIGNGYERQNDLAAEEKEFREIIDKLLK